MTNSYIYKPRVSENITGISDGSLDVR